MSHIASFKGIIEAEILLRSSGRRINISEMMIIDSPCNEPGVRLRLFYQTIIQEIIYGVSANIILTPSRNAADLKIAKKTSWPGRNSSNNRLTQEEQIRLKSIWMPAKEQ
jgi:hypothetical protein